MPNLKKQIVEWTLLDQYPNHWGAAMTVATVTSALRSCEYGEREMWCDLLSELLEGDPHSHAVLKKCYSGIANHEWELVPAVADSDTETAQAAIIAEQVTRTIKAIPNWRQSVFQLLWGHFTGVSALEILWGFDDAWFVRRLQLVPSRRIMFDDYLNPYIGDGGGYRNGELFDNHPGKFILYLPTVTGDSPVREGLGRVIAFWMAFKRWAARDFMGYAERYGKPTPIVTCKTGRESADENDVAIADVLIQSIGRGTQPGARIPDTLTVDFATDPASKGSQERTVHGSLIDLCDSQISKAVLGGTLTTDVGSTGGNRALGERQGEDQQDIQEAIAAQIDEAITRYLVRWIVRLNFGDAYLHLCPSYHTKIEQADDLESASKVLDTLVRLGLRVASADVSARFGWRLPEEDEETLKVATMPSPLLPGNDNTSDPEKDPQDEDEDPDDDGEE